MTLDRLWGLCLVTCLAWISSASAEYPAQSSFAVTVPEAGAKALEPIISVPLKDPSVCRGPDNAFYMTGSATASSSGLSPGAVHVWRSTDLIHWKGLGQVWVLPGDDNTQSVSSPEIHFIKEAFYVVYALPQGGIRLIKSESGAQGPYEDLGLLLPKGHKPSLFEDSRGRVYLLFDTHKIALLDLDTVTLANKPRTLVWQGVPEQGKDTPGYGGLFMFQKENRYFLFYTEPDVRLDAQVHDVYVTQGTSPYGPFEPAYIAIPHASQTCVFQDDMGHEWATFYASAQDTRAMFSGRPGLVPMTYTDEGRFRPAANVILEKGPVACLQPELDKRLVSPSVTRGHDGGYYMVASNSSWQALTTDCHVALWGSRDLQTWESMGTILDYEEDLSNQSSLDKPVPIQSAELMYSKSRSTYYLVFTTLDTTPKTWLFKSISNKPEGPFANVTDSFMVEGVDGFLYEEDDDLYLMWSNGKMARLNQKVTGISGPVHQLTTEDDLPIGSEGMCLVKSGKTYVWTAAQWHGRQALSRTYDLVAAVSDSLLGPYKSRQFVMPHAGHSTLFQDDKKQWYAVFSGHDRTAPFRNRPGIIRLNVKSDGTVMPAP